MLSSPIVASALAPHFPAPIVPLSSCSVIGGLSSCSASAYGSAFLPFFPRAAPLSPMGRRRRKLLLCAAASRESLYDTLGVSPSATEKEIKQAYRRLALKYHPDVNKEPDAQEKFLRIKHAYQTLVDPSIRSKYDSSRQYTNNWDGFSWASSSKSRTRPKEEEEFYGLGEFLTDLQVYIEDFFRDLQTDFQKREAAAASGKPKSLWEELAEVGEEFVEFLEKELNIVDSTEQSPWDNGKFYNFDFGEDGNARSENDSNDVKEKSEAQVNKGQTSKVENDIKEIEDMLAQLKEELGL